MADCVIENVRLHVNSYWTNTMETSTTWPVSKLCFLNTVFYYSWFTGGKITQTTKLVVQETILLAGYEK